MFDRATEKNSQGPCPFRAEGICTGDDCVMWNDDVNACGPSPISLHLMMKILLRLKLLIQETLRRLLIKIEWLGMSIHIKFGQ